MPSGVFLSKERRNTIVRLAITYQKSAEDIFTEEFGRNGITKKYLIEIISKIKNDISFRAKFISGGGNRKGGNLFKLDDVARLSLLDVVNQYRYLIINDIRRIFIDFNYDQHQIDYCSNRSNEFDFD